MPRLPTLDDLGARPTPASQRSVASNPYAGAVGDALGNIGEAATRASQTLFERQDKLQYAAAKTAILKADVTARQELQDDPDYETWGQRYNEKMKTAREAAVGMIGNHSDRKLFEADAELDAMRGNAELSNLANARRHQARVGTLDQSLIDLQDVGQNAPDDATREAVIGNAHASVDAAVAAGDISAAEGVQRKRQWTQGYIVQRVQSLKNQGDLDGATAYANAHRSALDPETEIRLDAQLRDATENRENQGYVEGLFKPRASQPTAVAGLLTPGNIDTHNRPVVHNKDGSISTVRTISIGTDQGEVLIPTVVGNKVVSDREAIAHYRQTGEHLGIFKDADSATAYAKSLHDEQAQEYGAGRTTAPASISRMVAITAQTESGSRERTSGGSLVTSPKGAQGMMQVMPATAANPGYGIRPWDGHSDADRSRVGRELLQALLNKYHGDAAKAWAAYNWDSSGTKIDRAVAKYGDNWLDHTPAETKAYVRKNVAALGGNTVDGTYSGPVGPDIPAINARIDADAAREGWTPERKATVRSMALARASQEATIANQAREENFNRALAKADTLGTGFTSVDQLGDDFYKASATDQHRLRQMAEANQAALAKGPEANGSVIRSLHVMAIEKPEQLAQTNLAQYKPFMTAAEFDEISATQAKAKMEAEKGPNAWNPRSGIQEAITWGDKFGGVKLDKDEDRYRVYRYMETRAREQSAANHGKPPTENDYQTFFREATQQVHYTRKFLGLDMLAPDSKERAYVAPSNVYRNLIIRNFKAVNGRNPTDDEIQQWFDRMGKPLGDK